MPDTSVLAFDIGGSKIAWGVVDDAGNVTAKDSVRTPQDRQAFLDVLQDIIKKHPEVAAVGLAVPAAVSKDHRRITFCTNIRSLDGFELVKALEETVEIPVTMDNDARCALIGESWLGAAADASSAIMLTIGTSVGGAVKQRGAILPAPSDVSLEISRLIADPADLFPSNTGQGTVDALIGGRSIEARYGVSLHEMAELVRKNDEGAKEFWGLVQHAFELCIHAIQQTYSCQMIIIGGHGVLDLEYYLGSEDMPCPVLPAKLGLDAGMVGAGRQALDAAEEAAKDWDEV